nr:hypothetical protein [Candidatus Sigynarchaeota archaeon]
MPGSKLPLRPDQLKLIVDNIKAVDGWNEGDYELALRAEWDNQRLPIIVALPRHLKVDYSPTFALMPDGNIVTPHDETAFKKILAHVYTVIVPADAAAIAELAVMFGAFGQPVGRVYTNQIRDRVGEKLKRKETGPVYKKKGSTHVIEFYTHNYDLLFFCDCIVEITGENVVCKAQLLKKKEN